MVCSHLERGSGDTLAQKQGPFCSQGPCKMSKPLRHRHPRAAAEQSGGRRLEFPSQALVR